MGVSERAGEGHEILDRASELPAIKLYLVHTTLYGYAQLGFGEKWTCGDLFLQFPLNFIFDFLCFLVDFDHHC